LGDAGEHIAVGRMQPLAAEIERAAVFVDRPSAPAGALARLEDDNGNALRLGQPPPGGDPRRAGADDRDIDFGGEAF